MGGVKKVVVLDYGSGNLRSAERALARVGADVTVTADPAAVAGADGLVVPGVGAFAACMAGLRAVDGPRIIGRRLAGGRPVLGIGVGMQQINLMCKGSLYLHLPEEQPRSLPHRDPSGGPHRHAVLIEPGTRLEEIYGGGEIRVNSHHHQAVRQPGPGLRAGARAPDGVIEAIEASAPGWFCVGVQWHPESETASALDLQLFECFVQACLRQAQPLSLAA